MPTLLSSLLVLGLLVARFKNRDCILYLFDNFIHTFTWIFCSQNTNQQTATGHDRVHRCIPKSLRPYTKDLWEWVMNSEFVCIDMPSRPSFWYPASLIIHDSGLKRIPSNFSTIAQWIIVFWIHHWCRQVFCTGPWFFISHDQIVHE